MLIVMLSQGNCVLADFCYCASTNMKKNYNMDMDFIAYYPFVIGQINLL